MSLIIKGLDMPKLNSVHEFLELTIWADGIVYARAVNAYNDTQLEDITAIQIPTPHGDLIDVGKYMYEGQVVVDYEKNDIILEAEE